MLDSYTLSSTLLAFAIAGATGVLIYAVLQRLRQRGQDGPHELRLAKLRVGRPRAE